MSSNAQTWTVIGFSSVLLTALLSLLIASHISLRDDDDRLDARIRALERAAHHHWQEHLPKYPPDWRSQ